MIRGRINENYEVNKQIKAISYKTALAIKKELDKLVRNIHPSLKNNRGSHDSYAILYYNGMNYYLITEEFTSPEAMRNLSSFVIDSTLHLDKSYLFE